jgi:DNA-binding NarL/FixJ family response regulator
MRAEGSLTEDREQRRVGPIQVAISLKNDGRVALLKPYERRVFDLLAKGKTNKEVATLPNISVRTAETYRERIMSTLDIHSGRELILYAVRNKLVDVG